MQPAVDRVIFTASVLLLVIVGVPMIVAPARPSCWRSWPVLVASLPVLAIGVAMTISLFRILRAAEEPMGV